MPPNTFLPSLTEILLFNSVTAKAAYIFPVWIVIEAEAPSSSVTVIIKLNPVSLVLFGEPVTIPVLGSIVKLFQSAEFPLIEKI